MIRWPHQPYAVVEMNAALARKIRSSLVCSPTGGGKTQITTDFLEGWLDHHTAMVWTNRKMLVEQTQAKFSDAGLAFGTRSASHGWNEKSRLQISSVQSEWARVGKGGSKPFPADLIIIDEAHIQTGETVRKLLEIYGCPYIGLTATPLDLGGMYEHLIVAGTVPQLRECGALLWCHHYGPDEPDMRKWKKLRETSDPSCLTENDIKKAMPPPAIWGRVWEWFCKLNPDHKPTILFAPGVKESIWFAEQFNRKGVSAAHIDGQDVWINGNQERTSQENREYILDQSRRGNITVLCNRFVLREGIDAPWLAHGIFATVFGSLQSYLQSGGRLLRNHPSLESVTLQDHGGNWWRHGSLNSERSWSLDLTENMAYGLRAERMRKKELREPFRCPQCGLIVAKPPCQCGWYGTKRSRPVISSDGKLSEMTGDIFRPRRLSQAPNGPKLWERMWHRSRTTKGRRTFRAAAALFAQENNWAWPDPSWPLMPTKEIDWFRYVEDVPRETLTR